MASDIPAIGILEGRTIRLDRDVALPAGTRVGVVITPPPLSRAEMLRIADEVCGSCADDPTFSAAVHRIVDERLIVPPRELRSFDDSPS